jgi:gas vesicle protein
MDTGAPPFSVNKKLVLSREEITMGTFTRKNAATKWARLALKFGLALTDAKLWADVRDRLQDSAEDARDEIRRRYDEGADRLQEANRALHGRNHWVAPTLNFLGGVGLGVGLGILFAPVSGEEARTALRDKVVDIKERVRGVAADAVHSAAATGTEGY